MESGEILSKTVARTGPEEVSEVMINVFLKQRKAVSQNQPFVTNFIHIEVSSFLDIG